MLLSALAVCFYKAQMEVLVFSSSCPSTDGGNGEQQDDSCFVGQRSGRVMRPLGSGEKKNVLSGLTTCGNLIATANSCQNNSVEGCYGLNIQFSCSSPQQMVNYTYRPSS